MSNSNVIIFGETYSRQRSGMSIRSVFEGITNKTLVDERGILTIQIKHDGKLHRVKVINAEHGLQEGSSPDERAFIGHRRIGLQEFRNINWAGKVLVLENEAGIVVAESQIITSPLPQHAEMAGDEAHCYGIALKPGEERKGYVQIMFKAQEVIARETGKKRMVFTVRVEDTRSIRARLHAGFRIVGCDGSPYGIIEDGGAGLLMEKSLIKEAFPFDPTRQVERVRDGQTLRMYQANHEAILATRPTEIAIPVSSGDEVAVTAHDMIEKALAAGYIGTGLLRPFEYGGRRSDESLLIFHRKDSSPFTEMLSLPLNLNSEFAQLREVIVGYSPDTAILKPEYAINSVAQNNIGNIDSIAFKDEHRELVEALRDEGIRIVHTSALGSDGRTAVFTRDPAFAIDDTFVVGQLERESRRYETEGMKMLSQSMKTFEIGDADEADGLVLEGGDVILLGEKQVVVGLGQRTNEKGLRKLAEFFPDYQFIGVRHADLHLDVLFTVTGEKTVLADIAQLPADFIGFFRESGHEIIVADSQEQISLGCNVLAINNNRVVAIAENRVTNQRLRDKGVQVIELSMPNIIKWGGGPRCLTCPTRRD